MAGHPPELPPEIWLCIFHHITYVPGTLVPEIYDYASLIGLSYTRTCNAALRETFITTRALVRVCKQWWHLASPYLYQSVYIGRARCLSSLSSTLIRSATGKGTVVGARPLGEYTQRLDIAIRDRAENANVERNSLATIIRCMPYLAIVSFATSNYSVADLPNHALDALHHSAASLRVLDCSSIGPEPSVACMATLLARCTQLRVLNCPRLIWSRELQHGGIPPTVTTLRLHTLIPVQIATADIHLSGFDPSITCRPEPTALQELILDLKRDLHHWKDLLEVYSDQLVSVQFNIYTLMSVNIDSHLQLLTRTCPRLRRLTITSQRFSSFIGPNLVFPPIVYLGLRATRKQSPKFDFKKLFEFLEELRSSVPSLRVVRLLNEHNVQCLLKTHTRFAVHALRPFMEGTHFRIEDSDGVLLTDKLNIVRNAARPFARDPVRMSPSSVGLV